MAIRDLLVVRGILALILIIVKFSANVSKPHFSSFERVTYFASNYDYFSYTLVLLYKYLNEVAGKNETLNRIFIGHDVASC